LRYPLGQPVTVGPITVQQRNTDGTYSLVDAGTLTTVVKVSAVDGTQTTTGTYSSPTHISLGKYQQDIPVADLTILGHYQWVVTSTGTGAGVTFGDFDVYDAGAETAVLPLQDAKDQLNIPQSSTASDAELQSFIATIESSLKRYTGGPLVNRAITERAEMVSGQTAILVRQRPLVSVTQILGAGGAAIDISGGLDLDVNAGIVRRKLGLPFYGPFFTWLPQVTVIAVAGWGTSVPAAFNSFARIVIQWLWTSQHGPAGRPSMGGQEMTTVPGFGFAIPNMAADLLEGSQNGVPFRSEAFI
jgi:hypothetical protein